MQTFNPFESRVNGNTCTFFLYSSTSIHLIARHHYMSLQIQTKHDSQPHAYKTMSFISSLKKNIALYAAALYTTYHCNSIIEQWFTKHDYMQLLVNMDLLEYSQYSYRVHSRDQTTKHQTRQQIYLKTYNNRICAKFVNRQEWGSYILYNAGNPFYMTSMCLQGATVWLVSPLYVSDCLSSWRKIGRSMGIIADTVFEVCFVYSDCIPPQTKINTIVR